MKECSVRNLTKTLAVLSLLAPASALPLGIGGIKMHSALNQNLNAEISLVLSAGEKLSDVKVNLAPPDKFDEAGVPWSYFLSKIKFEPVLRSDGSAVIKVISNEALKEPFLGLLLQVSWPKGSLYREFSVLVDPPEVYEQATVPVVNLPEQQQSYESATPIRRETVRQAATRSRPVSSNRYGPTSRSDTLWKIATRASRSRNVSVEQMMIAIYEANPGAFFKENINALSRGKTLKIPDRDAVLKLSRKDALAEYARHTHAWSNRTAAVPVETSTTASVDPVVATDEQQSIENQLQLEAPSESSVSQNAVIKPGKDQTSSTNESKVSDNSDSELPKSLSGNNIGTDATKKQLTEMQQQLTKMQELLALKDQQLAALQQQAASRQEPGKIDELKQQPSTQSSQVAPTQAVTVPSSQMNTDADHAFRQSSPTIGVPEAVSKPATVKPKPKLENKPELRKKQLAVKRVEEESDSNYLFLGTAGLTLISLLGWLWWRKRKIDAKTDTESMFAHSFISTPEEENEMLSELPTEAPISSEKSNPFNVENVEPVGESSFLSEFTPSDFDAFDTDRGEIDPISEADVYLAYGRYQQAEELMRQAIIEQPDRDECKLKLLEIFYASENKNGFESYADELAAHGRKDDRIFWSKVSEMGHEICPESTLFTVTASQFTVTDDADEESPDDNLTKNPNDSRVDFDSTDTIGEFSEESFDLFKKDELEESNELQEHESLDFDLGSLGGQGGEEDLSEGDNSELRAEGFLATNNGESHDSESDNHQEIAFDLGNIDGIENETDRLVSDEKPTIDLSKSDKQASEIELETLDFNFDDVSVDDSKAVAADSEMDITPPLSSNELSFDEQFNFNFDLDEDKAESSDDSFAVSDLTDMDEFETKLDLARAYIDMGDETSAKEIVNQVLEKGSDEQKKVAQKFIDNLS